MSNNKENELDVREDFKEHIKSFGHLYALLVLFLVTVYTRIQGFSALRRDDGWIFLGNDAWYHARATMYNVENYPFPIGFDPRTGYPEGSLVGTFGTLYDFVHATVALIFGLGDPSPETVEMILVFSSPILSGIAVVVVYYVAKYITESTVAGLSASVILAFIPGMFYERGLAGFAQHHIAEAILLVLSVLMIMKAVEYAEENFIIKEVITEFNDDVKEWSMITGLAILTVFAYYLTWPPAMMLFGLIGMSAVLYSLFGFSNSRSRSGLLTLTIISGSMLLMVLIRTPIPEASVSNPSYLHLGVAALAFTMSLFVWVLSVVADERSWKFPRFLGIILSTGFIALVLTVILQPGIISEIFGHISRLLGYPFGLGGDRIATIAEERTPSILELSVRQYGLMLPTALFGVCIIAYDMFKKNQEGKGFAPEMVLFVVSMFIIIVSFRTVRFNYYLAPFVAILASIAIYKLVQIVEIPDNRDEFQGYHILTIILLLILFVPVLFVPVAQPTVFLASDLPTEEYNEWEGPLEWMSENTAEDGLESYGSYSEPFSYPEESYGVMSWWDYGHWITYSGDRTPVSNPFQQNAQQSAEFLLAQDPEEAESVIERMGDEAGEEDARVDYIAIDWQMASPLSKYPAIEEWHPELEQGDSYTQYYASQPGQRAQLQFNQRNQVYYETMLGRLFVGHGGAIEASNYTIDYNTQQGIRTVQPGVNPIEEHNTTQEARDFAQDEVEVSRGGLSQPPERVEALDNYRLVKSGQGRLFGTQVFGFEAQNINQNIDRELEIGFMNENPSTVKIFQRVDGAEVEATGFEDHDELTLEVEMTDPVFSLQPSEFTYEQRVNVENGEFTATLPYSTTGYNDVENPPEVQSNSQYQVLDEDGNVVETFDVEEVDVIEGETITLEAGD